MTESAGSLPHDNETSAEPRLGRGDWVEAALEVLVEEGVEAVRITRLADGLSVTRGSFYWHFKDREDLLEALVGRWRRGNTAAVIEAVAGAESLTDGILALFDAWIDPARFDPRLDSAMRDWARGAPEIRSAVEEADKARVEAIAELFKHFDYAMPEALIRARVIYFGQVGYYALAIEEPMAERFSYLDAYFTCFTGRSIDAERAAAYRTRHLGLAEETP